MHKSRPIDSKPTILRPKTETKKIKSISSFILERIELLNKKFKKNAKNGLVSLTLRNSIDLAIITEAEIQKESSPYISKQYTKITEHKSRLKFILTGVDDSALLPAEVEKKALYRAAKIEILKELIEEQEKSLDDVVSVDDSLKELRDQDKKLSQTIVNERSILDVNEERYNKLVFDRSTLRKELEIKTNRINEIAEMLSRFKLLQEQYTSDMSRLDNITETGVLLEALPTEKCPMCGQETSNVEIHQDCDVNIKEIASAAASEKLKIVELYEELLITMNSLYSEGEKIENQTPNIAKEISSIVNKLNVLNPEMVEKRSRYSDLFTTKSEIDKSIEQYEQLKLLNKKKEELEKEAPKKENKGKDDNERALPTSALFKLSQSVKSLLQEWSFPNSGDVHFDKKTGDFVINGKHRISNGKGYRAITHAAATLGLMKFTDGNDLPHFGFTILDSPLLAYEEPDNEADDLSGTDVNVKFFDSLCKWDSKQIIVFENKKSIPNKYSSGVQVVQFTKKNSGRYGFFPIASK